MPTDEKIQDCWDRSLLAFGSSEIFNRRSIKARRKIRLLSFVGIAVPVLVGGLVGILLGIEEATPYLRLIVLIGGLLALVQLVVSLWSLVAKWDDAVGYSSESCVDNNELFKIFRELAQNPPEDFDERFKIAKERERIRSIQDQKAGIREAEKRRGMRAGLRQFERSCAGCGEVPYDLKPSNCPVCGNYGFRLTFKSKKRRLGENNRE